MTIEARERLAVLVERHLAGLPGPTETEELSKLLTTSAEAREIYLRVMEVHLDLESILLETVTEDWTMARISLKCACGWNFFVPGTVQGNEALCSNCGGAVPIPGRKASRGGPTYPGVIGAEKRARQVILLVSAAAAVLLISVILLTVSGGSQPRGEDDDAARRPTPQPATPTGPARPIAKEPPMPAPAPIAPAPVAAPAPAETAPKEDPKPVAAAPMDLPAEIVKALRDDLLSLKEWHVNLALSAQEKTRVDALISSGKGLAADVEFLKGLVEGARLRVVREEAGVIQETYARLQKEALESLPVDKVTMNDGRVLHGRIVGETEVLVKLERKFASGVAGILPLAKSGIQEVQKGKGLGAEFKTRWDEARKAGGPAKMGSLLTWCKDSTLPLQASLAAYALLVDNPGLPEARVEAGFAGDPISRMLEAEKQGGFIPHEGRRWVPKELKDKLIRDGYVILDGKWVSKKDRLIGVPGLFRYETQADKPVVISGPVAQDEIVTYVTVQDLTTNSFVAKPEIKYIRRFFASVPLVVTPVRTAGPVTLEVDNIIIQDRVNPVAGTVSKGEVFLTIPVGAPMLEASVMTSAEVKLGATIAVSLILDGNRVPLYTCGTKEDKSHKLPTELIRGKTDVQLVAEITSRAVYRQKTETKRVRGLKKEGNNVIQKALDVTYLQLVPEYQAVLFPSNSNTQEVFRLTVVCADPSPALDKLFENARDILK